MSADPVDQKILDEQARNAPLTKPRRLRANSFWISAEVTSIPAGRPSIVATKAGPWDSPAVSHRIIYSLFHYADFELVIPLETKHKKQKI